MSLESVSVDMQKELLELRAQIDRLDESLVLLLANRFALTRRVGHIKAGASLESFDPQREEQKLQNIRELCAEHGLNPELAADILAQLMKETVRNHEKIRLALGVAKKHGQ